MMKAEAAITGHSRAITFISDCVAPVYRVSFSNRSNLNTRMNRKSIRWCKNTSKKNGAMANKSMMDEVDLANLSLPAAAFLYPGSSTQQYMRRVYSKVKMDTAMASKMRNSMFSK